MLPIDGLALMIIVNHQDRRVFQAMGGLFDCKKETFQLSERKLLQHSSRKIVITAAAAPIISNTIIAHSPMPLHFALLRVGRAYSRYIEIKKCGYMCKHKSTFLLFLCTGSLLTRQSINFLPLLFFRNFSVYI